MLPKFARLFLLAAVLASSNARAAEEGEPYAVRRPGTCEGGRITNAKEAAAFAGCRAVRGDLTIEGSELSDLSALAELRSVSGALTIRDNAKLRNLDGLEGLVRTGSLTIRGNGLYGTRGIEALRKVGTLVIANNPFLISLHGFRRLTRVGTLIVRKNPRVCAQLGLFPALDRVVNRSAVDSNHGLSRADVASLFARIRRGSR